MILNMHMASIKEPYWSLIDNKGMRHVELFSLYKCEDSSTNQTAYGLVIWMLHINIVTGSGFKFSDKALAYFWTAIAGFCVVSAIGGASWETAWFACVSAWMAWAIALRA